jgi:putative PEP-CTERM system TPR-repeat lipoprotein
MPPQNLLSVLLLTIGLMLLVACSDSTTPDEYVARAIEQQSAGSSNGAILELKNALQKEPRHAEARYLLGTLYLEQGLFAAAEKELYRAIDYGVDRQSVAAPLARVLLAQGKHQELIDSVGGLSLTPSSAQAQLLALKGHAYLGLGRPNAAEQFYDEALQLNMTSAEAKTGKAQLAISRDEYEVARKHIDEVLESMPDFAFALNVLGLIESRADNLEAAEQAYLSAQQSPLYRNVSLSQLTLIYIQQKQFNQAAKAIASLKQGLQGNPQIDYLEGFLAFRQQRFPEAKVAFEALLGKLPKHVLGLFYSGATNAYLGNNELAKQQLTRHLSQNPGNSFAQKLLAQVELAEGNPDEAERLTLPVLEQYPDDLVALNLLASASLNQGNQKAALAYLQQAVKARPESTDAHIRLGEELGRQGQVQSGLKALQEAYRLDPDNSRVVETLVRQYQRAGQPQQALNLAREHQQHHPDQALPHTLVGMVHVSLKDSDAAAKAFRRALSIDPATTSALNGLAILAIRNKQLDVAQQHYQTALDYKPGDYQTVMNLVTLKKMQGDQAGLGSVLEQAVSANPQAIELRVMLGRVYLAVGEAKRVIELLDGITATNRIQQGNLLGLRSEAQLAARRFGQAQISLSELAKLAPEDARVQFYLAQANEGLNDRAKMREHLNMAARFNPDYLPAKLALARGAVEDRETAKASKLLAELEGKIAADDVVYVMTKAQFAELNNNLPAAIADYKHLFDLSPNSANLLRLSRVQWRNGDKDSALKALQNWLAEHPGHLRVQHELAQRYISQQRIAEAIALYEDIIKSDADNALALNNLASLLVDSKPKAALAYAERTYALMPQDPAVMDTLAGAMLAVQDTSGAQRMVERSLARQPENPNFQYRHAQLYAAMAENAKALDLLTRILATEQPFSQRAKAQALREQLAQ